MAARAWVEKRRPKTLDQVQGQELCKRFLKQIVQKNLPLGNLLFYGPPGTGKTSMAYAFCRDYFGTSDLAEYVLPIRASDDRGIGEVRSRIAKFVDMPAPNRRTKVVLLDEVEGMTEAALFALRKIMEENNNTAFILLCNEIRFLNTPILSRCIKFRFYPLTLLEMAKTCAEDFQLDLPDEVLGRLVAHVSGDVREMIKLLESTKCVSLASQKESSQVFSSHQTWLLDALHSIPDSVFTNLFSGIALANQAAEEQDASKIMLQTIWETAIDFVLDQVYHPVEFIDRLFLQALNRDEVLALPSNTTNILDSSAGSSAATSPSQDVDERRQHISYWFSVCQAMLGAKLHLQRGSDASTELYQVLYTLFGPLE